MEIAGRLGTRDRRGGPSRRWQDGVFDAQAYAEQHRLSSLLLKSPKAKQKYNVLQVASLTDDALNRFDEIEAVVEQSYDSELV